MIYRINEMLDQPELLAMLAEEASELAKAALKLRRAIDGTNPTPVSIQEAVIALNEEIADVNLCLDQISCVDFDEIMAVMKRKQARWIVRLLEKEADDGADQ